MWRQIRPKPNRSTNLFNVQTRGVQEEKTAIYYLHQRRLDHRRGETDRWQKVRRWMDGENDRQLSLIFNQTTLKHGSHEGFECKCHLLAKYFDITTWARFLWFCLSFWRTNPCDWSYRLSEKCRDYLKNKYEFVCTHLTTILVMLSLVLFVQQPIQIFSCE